MRMARLLGDGVLILAAWLLVLAVGCRSIPHSPVLPVRHSIVRDQLIVYSDFPLPPDHRLLDDLVAGRSELCNALALAKTEEPIHVYLFRTPERFREYMVEYHPDFPKRRAFFVESDTRLAVYAHWGDRIAEDLRHEVAHGYLHAAISNLPLWLDEGLAEYFEVPRGYGGMNRPHFEQLTATFEQEGWRPNLSRLESLTAVAEMTQLDYAESWAWVYFLLNTDPARRELLQEYLQALRKDGTAPPLSSRLRQAGAEPEVAVLEYLRSLRR